MSGPQQETLGAARAPEAQAPRAPVLPHEVDALIRKRVYAAIGVGLAPLPLVDLAGLCAIQMELVRALARQYGVPFRFDLAKPLVASLVGSVVPVAAVPVVFSLLRAIPVIGWTSSALTVSVTGGAATYALGRVFARHFAAGGTLEGANVETLRNSFKATYEEGKEFVSNLRGKKGQAAAPAATEARPTA
jgi:uncharacterized protein (DUF697 family)